MNKAYTLYFHILYHLYYSCFFFIVSIEQLSLKLIYIAEVKQHKPEPLQWKMFIHIGRHILAFSSLQEKKNKNGQARLQWTFYFQKFGNKYP